MNYSTLFFSCLTVSITFSTNAQRSNEPTITIGLAGDTMLGRMVNKKLKKNNFLYPWGSTLPLLKKHDINIINLETTLTDHTQAEKKVYNFRSDPKNIAVLQHGNIHVVSLANNHSKDFGNQGLLETIQHLKKAGIAYVGAGKNSDDARAAIILEKQGIKVGIYGFTDNEPTWKATKTTPGTNYVKVGNLEAVLSDIQHLRKKVDIVIVSVHWGPNMREYPTKEFQQFAHKLIDHGVDIIHGHSAHIFQGIETYKKKLILYDTGDFVDDYAVDPLLRNDISFLFQVTVSKNGVENLTLIPTLISNMQVNIAPEQEAHKAFNLLQKRSAPFNTGIEKNKETITLEKG